MKHKTKNIWITLVILSYLGLTYVPKFGWGISFLGSVLIIVFGMQAWPKSFKQKFGIPTKVSQYISSLILLVIFFAFTFYIISQIRLLNKYGFGIGNIYNLFHICFYTLNEELILGGLVLISLRNKLKRLNPIYISLLVAFVFSVMHYVFYRWVFQGEAQGVLTFLTILSLFMVGIIRNNLILKFGHIGYSWALHFSWMAIMFGCLFYDPYSKAALTQTERFNLLIGNNITVGIAMVFVIVTTILLISNKYKVDKSISVTI